MYAYISALIPGYIVISIFNQTCLVKCIVCVLEVTVFFLALVFVSTGTSEVVCYMW